MTTSTNKQWLLKKRPVGMFTIEDFELNVAKVPELSEGQALAKILYVSFDPTQRGWAAFDTYLPAVALGETMRAVCIGQVVESRSANHKKGDLVAGIMGFQEYFVIDPKMQGDLTPMTMPGFFEPKLTLALMLTGLTAYFGLLDIGKPKKSETVLVSGAAGATGSIAVQIARIKGARVVGIAGGPEKCRWLKEVARVDEAIDYKNENLEARIKETCPNGIDVFFDNVGGETLEAALHNLAMHARIVLCGGISQYNSVSNASVDDSQLYGIKSTMALTIARASMTGFIVMDFAKRYPEGFMMLNKWIEDGDLVQEIDLQEGFENIPSTLLRIFEGKNLGKQLLKLSNPPLALNVNTLQRVGFNLMKSITAWRKG